MNKEKIKELKKANGNKYVKNNDLLWYIISRLDDLEKESSRDREEVTKVKTQIRVFWILLPIIVAVCIYISTIN